MAKHHVYLCIGGNLGEREANLEETRMFIDFNMGDVIRTSSIYETAAWGMESAPAFLNQVVEINTDLEMPALLAEIRELEEFYGRERNPGKYLDREMDVDILFYDDVIFKNDELEIPHPRMTVRRFVLEPLNEIAPELEHPVLHKPVSSLLKECTDETPVRKI